MRLSRNSRAPASVARSHRDVVEAALAMTVAPGLALTLNIMVWPSGTGPPTSQQGSKCAGEAPGHAAEVRRSNSTAAAAS